MTGDDLKKHLEEISDHVDGKKILQKDPNLNNINLDIEKIHKDGRELSAEEKERFLDNRIAYEKREMNKDLEKIITSFTDKIHLAEQVIDILPLYYDNSGLWWRWSQKKCRWQIIDEVDLMNSVAWSSPLNTVNSKERGEIIQALKQVSRARKPIDTPLNWLQFDDEVIDLKTGERFKATPQYFLTNPLPYKIGREEETPNIDRIFAEWVGENYVKLLKEIIAYCMIRDYPLNRIFCFIGAGMNGKSKFLDLLGKFIGPENCCSTELDTLLNSRFGVTKLHKKLVCQMGETNFNEISKTSILKRLTGGDLVSFEYKNKNPFDERNYAKILIATNNLPTTTDKTIGFYRRWVIIDFPNQFTEKKDILSEIPEQEYNNLSNQLVKLLMDVLSKRQFTNEGTIEERQQKYEDHSNPLEKFLKENTIEDFNSNIFKWEFSERLNAWCKDNRFREITDVSIGKKMKQIGIENKLISSGQFGDNKQWRAWIGLKWK